MHCRIWCSALEVLAAVVWSWDACCVHCESYCSTHTLVLLMMGIMMPETCWDRSLIINIRLVASCWFLSLHPKYSLCFHLVPKYCSSHRSWHGQSVFLIPAHKDAARNYPSDREFLCVELFRFIFNTLVYKSAYSLIWLISSPTEMATKAQHIHNMSRTILISPSLVFVWCQTCLFNERANRSME